MDRYTTSPCCQSSRRHRHLAVRSDQVAAHIPYTPPVLRPPSPATGPLLRVCQTNVGYSSPAHQQSATATVRRRLRAWRTKLLEIDQVFCRRLSHSIEVYNNRGNKDILWERKYVIVSDLFRVVSGRMTDPETVAMIKRALAQGVVLDTWMNGEDEERFSDEAEIALVAAIKRWTSEALRTKAVFPNYFMPEQYVRCVFHEILFSTALYAAQTKRGYRAVTIYDVKEAIHRLSRFIASEPEGLTAVGGLFSTISMHEDLNAIAYYGRMQKEDFLFGRLHRPWSNLVLAPSLDAYQQMDLIRSHYGSGGNMLSLTVNGLTVLARLREILSDAGELRWRSDNQRWVIFAETDYDRVYGSVFPDVSNKTREYIGCLGLKEGMRVLEIGAGTGRVTVDLGLCDKVGPNGSITAIDPVATLLRRLAAKCDERGIRNVHEVQCVAENLPFVDDSFDAAIAVFSLHFTDAPTAVAEMVRVTKPGGFVSVLSPPPEADLRAIPMVAMWFRPLTDMAERLGVPFSERNGLPVGLLKELFERNTDDVRIWGVPVTHCARDYRNFLTFMLKGGAFFQNIFSRLPYQERWGIMRRLEEDGAKIIERTSEKEKYRVYRAEAAYGRVPAKTLPQK